VTKRWKWIQRDVLLAIHEAQLAEHGGAAGVRDPALFESAISRPRNLAAYESPDAADLAASYAYGISRNHAFIDGNKRTAFVAAELFLLLNGYQLLADDAGSVVTMLAVAAGDMTEPDLAAWLREHTIRRKPG
jgi:death-on-curing protein